MRRSQLLILLAVLALIASMLAAVMLTGGFEQFTAQGKLERILADEAMSFPGVIQDTVYDSGGGCGIYLVAPDASDSIRMTIDRSGFTVTVDQNPPTDGYPESLMSRGLWPGWLSTLDLRRMAARGELEKWVVVSDTGERFGVEFYHASNASIVLFMNDEDLSIGRRMNFDEPENSPDDAGPIIGPN